MRDFKGKTAIVTGAASGIGLGIAKALAHAGANIVLADLRPERLEAAQADIKTIGVETLAVTTDVSDPASVAAAGEAASRPSARSTSPSTTPASRCTGLRSRRLRLNNGSG
jgi:NAD(P)-dependent dehydrogenase (short-subunit alcohol dehydrogenase family)